MALSTADLTKTYGDEEAVSGVSLDLQQGEFFALIGPSGCGKTTVLRILAGLTAPDEGVVRLDGEPVTDQPPRARDTNLVFQDLVLFPHMTVAENVAYGLKRAGVSTSDRERRVDDALSLVDLAGFGDRDPEALSGGQQQRVALARALVNEPAVLLLDEPLASLDRSLRDEMQAEFRRIQRQSDTTFLYVTHDQESAMSMADRLAVMRDGSIVDVGRPERLYERPRTAFTATFLGDAALVDGEVQSDGGETVRVETPAGTVTSLVDGATPARGETVTLAVRPEAVTVGDGPLSSEVIDRAYKGFYEEATIELDDGSRLTIREADGPATRDEMEAVPTDGGSSERRFRVGETVAFDVERAVLVDRDDSPAATGGADVDG
jgi:spermidine/putrescine transport system ATP-binding protein